MHSRVDDVSKRFYSGLWGVLARWFRVPRDPPALPTTQGEQIESFRPALGFLRYLKFLFWLALLAVDLAILILWTIVVIEDAGVGLALLPLALLVAIVPDIVAYLAIHLRYDTTWYVMSARSLRMRRGIWVIRETTITFENIQNVTVRQGPLQRWFGIADVLVETAGGGASAAGKHGAAASSSHSGLVEGVADAARIREQILSRQKGSRSSGLGDEDEERAPEGSRWSAEHLAVLREIRDVLRG